MGCPKNAESLRLALRLCGIIFLKVEKFFFFVKFKQVPSVCVGGRGFGKIQHISGGSVVDNLPIDLANPKKTGTTFLHKYTENKSNENKEIKYIFTMLIN